MVGILGDSASYTQLANSSFLTRQATVQPSPLNLGVTKQDTNIDVTVRQLIHNYEQKYGSIDLQQIDFAVPLNELIPAFRRLNKRHVSSVIIDYRNENLAQAIHGSKYQKVLVLYGSDHKKGTFKLLNELDGSWKVLKPN